MKINVINIHVEKPVGYIYIGRDGHRQMHYGNPFTHISEANLATIKVPTREDAVQAFEDWLRGYKWQQVEPERRRWILAQIDRLARTNDDLTFGCFCAPKRCHGDMLAKMILEVRESLFGEKAGES